MVILPNIIVWLLGMFALDGQPTSFCSCVVAPGDPVSSEVAVPKAFESADAVFFGRVMSGRILEGIPFVKREFTFSVIEQWKGEELANIVVRTGKGGGDCGYKFELGRYYLVYANLGEAVTEYEGYNTGICTRTGGTNEKVVRGDLEVLRSSAYSSQSG